MKNELCMLLVFCSTKRDSTPWCSRRPPTSSRCHRLCSGLPTSMSSYVFLYKTTFNCQKLWLWICERLFLKLRLPYVSSFECDADNDEWCTPRSRQIKFNLHFSIRSRLGERKRKKKPLPQKIEILGSHVNTINDAVYDLRYCECACSHCLWFSPFFVALWAAA